MCLPGADSITFWRADAEGEATWVLGAAASDFHVHVTFDDGDATATLSAEELPLAQGGMYSLSGPAGAARQSVEFVVLPNAPNDAEDLAVALAEKGCSGQLDLLSEKLAN